MPGVPSIFITMYLFPQGRREEAGGARSATRPPPVSGPCRGPGSGAGPGRGRIGDPSGRRKGWEGGLGGTRWPQRRRRRRRVPGHRPCREPWDRARTRKAGRTGSPAQPRTRGQPGRNQPHGLCLRSLPPPPAHTCNARHTPVNRKVLWENVVHRCGGLFLILSLEGRQVKILSLISKLSFYLHLPSTQQTFFPTTFPQRCAENKEKRGHILLCEKPLPALHPAQPFEGSGCSSKVGLGPRQNHCRQMRTTRVRTRCDPSVTAPSLAAVTCSTFEMWSSPHCLRPSSFRVCVSRSVVSDSLRSQGLCP